MNSKDLQYISDIGLLKDWYTYIFVLVSFSLRISFHTDRLVMTEKKIQTKINFYMQIM